MVVTPAELAKRIELLEAYQAIEANMYRYTRAADYGPPEDWADCFMPDGVYEVAFLDGRVERAVGTTELVKFAIGLNSHVGGRHFVMAPDIHIDGDTATVTAPMGSFGGIPDNARVGLIGRYHDVLKKCPDGRWRFVSRRSEILGRSQASAAAQPPGGSR